MKKGLRIADTVIRLIEDAVSVGSLVGIVGIAFASTIARYFFKSGFLWGDEVSQALLVLMGMFGCARAVRTNGHTEFTTLQKKIKSKQKRIAVRACILILTVGFLIFLFVTSIGYAQASTLLSAVLKIPRRIYYLPVPIGFALCIYEYIRNIKGKVIDDPVEDLDLVEKEESRP